jgi:hypothetical protein
MSRYSNKIVIAAHIMLNETLVPIRVSENLPALFVIYDESTPRFWLRWLAVRFVRAGAVRLLRQFLAPVHKVLRKTGHACTIEDAATFDDSIRDPALTQWHGLC